MLQLKSIGEGLLRITGEIMGIIGKGDKVALLHRKSIYLRAASEMM
jgi:hypothetical protein